MLTQLEFENFKSFERKQTVPLRPISLVFGKNSAGKSSVLQLLRLASSAASHESLDLPYSDPEIRLVSHQHVTYRNNQRQISLSVSVSKSRLAGDDVKVSANYSPNLTQLSFESRNSYPSRGVEIGPLLRFSGPKTINSIEDLLDGIEVAATCMSEADTVEGLCEKYNWESPAFEHTLIHKWFESLASEAKEMRLVRGHNHSYVSDMVAICENRLSDEISGSAVRKRPSILALLIRALNLQMAYEISGLVSVRELGLRDPQGRVLSQVVEGFIEGLLPSRYAYRTEIAQAVRSQRVTALTRVFTHFLSQLRLNCDAGPQGTVFVLDDIRSDLQNIRYLGPIREVLTRHDFGFPRGSNGNDASSNGRVLRALGADPTLLDNANASFRALEIPYEAQVVTLESSSVPWLERVFTLVLSDSSGTKVSLEDVGFGIGQVLPVLLEAQLGGCLLVEQPELHLHPALQASLAEELVRAVKRTNGQVILETHSEHMVLRLQRMIRRGDLDPKDVAILVVTSAPKDFEPHSELSSTVRLVEIDPSGELAEPWPPGFFDTAIEEMLLD